MEQVFNDKAHCCGCGSCFSICPQKAISMECDSYGFIYPKIDKNRCIDCGACRKICTFHAVKEDKDCQCYAAINIDEEEMMKSTSGGTFAGIASRFLDDGDVCGVKASFHDGNIEVKHALIDDKSELKMLQGSKYVQSHMWYCIDDLRNALKSGRKVLFSGTPCQVAGIKSLFSKYVGTQLFTIDIICHGVPSQKLFNDYINKFQEKNKVRLIKFDFRNKKFGWGLDGLAVGKELEGKGYKKIKISPDNSSYYRFFLGAETYRESCYQCPYACKNRVGDITIGDYWGVEKYDPQLLRENGGAFEENKGVSCLLINTDFGQELIKKYGNKIRYFPIKIENVMKINTQLHEPAKHSRLRTDLLEAYRKSGYLGVHKIYEKICFKTNLKMKIKKIVPKKIWSVGKTILKK